MDSGHNTFHVFQRFKVAGLVGGGRAGVQVVNKSFLCHPLLVLVDSECLVRSYRYHCRGALLANTNNNVGYVLVQGVDTLPVHVVTVRQGSNTQSVAVDCLKLCIGGVVQTLGQRQHHSGSFILGQFKGVIFKISHALVIPLVLGGQLHLGIAAIANQFCIICRTIDGLATLRADVGVHPRRCLGRGLASNIHL